MCEIPFFISTNLYNISMQDTGYKVRLDESYDVSFWFDDYYVAVVWNELLLMYDAHIYKQTCDGVLVHYTSTGGKSLQSASQSARQVILGKTQR